MHPLLFKKARCEIAQRVEQAQAGVIELAYVMNLDCAAPPNRSALDETR